jgi:ferritin-like metal-binding protein YciE
MIITSYHNRMTLDNIHELFVVSLKDLYSGEKQLVSALPKMAKGATSENLRKGFEEHLKETEGQVQRLEQIADLLEINLGGNKCEAMAGLITEGSEFLGIEGSPSVIDLGLIGAAQKVEHYEIAGYLSAMALAEMMGHEEAADLLGQTLEEEIRTDEKLQMVAEDELYPLAIETIEGEDMEEEDDDEDTEETDEATE